MVYTNNNNYLAYDIKAINSEYGIATDRIEADTIRDLSNSVPVSINGNDSILQCPVVARIGNSEGWEVIIRGCNKRTGKWEILPDDPRVFAEDLDLL